MAPNRLLLHFGKDALLTEARALVLESAGYDVLAVHTQREALQILRQRPVDLVVACHSVPPEELEAAIGDMKRLKGRVPVIVIHVGRLAGPQRSLADGFVDGLRGPEHLLSQVASFLSRRRPTAAAS